MARPPLVLLHGALGAQSEFEALSVELSQSFEIHRLDFEGHGASKAPSRPFRIEHFAENIVAYCDRAELRTAYVFGFSMGGYVALYLARHEPGRVTALATLGTKLEWTNEVAAREAQFLDPERLKHKVPAFALELERRHPGSGWETVLARTRDLLSNLGAEPRLQDDDFAALALPVRLMLGDRDKTVSLEETLSAYRRLERGELEVLPQTPHPLVSVPVGRLAASLGEFFMRVDRSGSIGGRSG